MQNLDIIVDLQFGSTGKGLFAGYLAMQHEPDTLITAWGPNAGHTYIDKKGKKFINIMLPNGIVSPKLKRVLIGPGSIIDPVRLLWEMREYEDAMVAPWNNMASSLRNVTLAIHEHAAVRQEHHIMAEAGYGFKIGSTMKGVGEAIIEKIRRRPEDSIIAGDALHGTELQQFLVTADEYQTLLSRAQHVQVEGAQGFSLSINHGFYPYVTSRDCTTAQLFQDCAIPFNDADFAHIHGVARTYPIRVANRFDPETKLQIGTSGPCYGDQRELDWKTDLGREPELTTVTKLPRRIFSFSEQQIEMACRMNGVDDIFLNFANYCCDVDELESIIDKCERHAPVCWLGEGSTHNDVKER